MAGPVYKYWNERHGSNASLSGRIVRLEKKKKKKPASQSFLHALTFFYIKLCSGCQIKLPAEDSSWLCRICLSPETDSKDKYTTTDCVA